MPLLPDELEKMRKRWTNDDGVAAKDCLLLSEGN